MPEQPTPKATNWTTLCREIGMSKKTLLKKVTPADWKHFEVKFRYKKGDRVLTQGMVHYIKYTILKIPNAPPSLP